MTQPISIWEPEAQESTIAVLWDDEPTERAGVGASAGQNESGPTGGVSRDDRMWNGRAVITGTRIPVFMVVDLHEEGLSAKDICRRYPHLSEADVWDALAHGGRYRGQVNADRADFVSRIPKRYRY